MLVTKNGERALIEVSVSFSHRDLRIENFSVDFGMDECPL